MVVCNCCVKVFGLLYVTNSALSPLFVCNVYMLDYFKFNVRCSSKQEYFKACLKWLVAMNVNFEMFPVLLTLSSHLINWKSAAVFKFFNKFYGFHGLILFKFLVKIIQMYLPFKPWNSEEELLFGNLYIYYLLHFLTIQYFRNIVLDLCHWNICFVDIPEGKK